MKITAVGAGSRGDVEPLVHLGKEMKSRGHAFKLVCLPRFKEYVVENGLEFAPVDFDGEYMMRSMLTECPDGMAYINGMKEVYRRNPEMMDQVYEACVGADLVLYILLGGFAHHAAEVLGIPCVRCFFYPFDKTNRYNIMLADVKEGSFINGLVYTVSEFTMNLVTKDLLNEWRVGHGLKKWGLFSDYRKMKGEYKLTLYPYSELLVPREPKWKDHIHVTGYWMDDGRDTYIPDEKLKMFLEAGDPPIYVGFGSIVFKDMDQVQAKIYQAIKETGVRAVISSSWMKWQESEDDNICYVDYVPHSYLFRHVKGVIHHGGAGTTAASLRAGVPTQVLSFGGDQYFWGMRVHEAGAGPKPLDNEHKGWSVEDMKNAILELTSGKYDRKAKKLGEKLRAEDGCSKAADILERYWQKRPDEAGRKSGPKWDRKEKT